MTHAVLGYKWCFLTHLAIALIPCMSLVAKHTQAWFEVNSEA